MAVMLTCVLMWLGRRVAARAISCLSFQIGQDPVLLLIPPLLALLAAETIFGKNVDGDVTNFPTSNHIPFTEGLYPPPSLI